MTEKEVMNLLDDLKEYTFVIYNHWDDFYYEFVVFALDEVKAYEKALMRIDSDTDEIYNMY